MLIKYTPLNPPMMNLRVYLYEELRRISSSINNLITVGVLLKELGTRQIELGPPDSAGPGYRTLKIPN